MGHDESFVGKFRAAIVQVSGAAVLAGNTGSLKVSGAKLFLDNGTGWEVVTSTAV